LFPQVPEKPGAATVDVGIAVVLRPGKSGRFWVLIGRRFPAAHLQDLWEFPGGKIDAGESGADCVRREVEEETGVRVRVRSRLADRLYTYADREVRLEIYLCDYLEGTPQAIGCRAVRWVSPQCLDCYPFPDADSPILEKLRRAVDASELV
jgi:mutator protein MutT